LSTSSSNAAWALWPLIESLCPAEPESTRREDGDAWGALVAGQALLETANLKRLSAADAARVARVRRWLVHILEEGRLPAIERARAGDILARLGDPRFTGPYLLPEFVTIPAGIFWMGSDDAEVARLIITAKEDWQKEAFRRESPCHQVELDAFALAKYPTTNAMFRCFIEAGGYADARWWDEAKAAKVWRPDGTVKDWLGDVRSQPAYWDDTRFNSPSQPAVGVTWYEAVAYCRWLTAALNDGYVYRLPTETEWERAARGKAPTPSSSPAAGGEEALPSPVPTGEGPEMGAGASRYPWGDDWIEGRCNSKELGLGRTTPVGIFPQGASAEGVLDLAGNVWEWCNDWYDEKAYQRRAGSITRNPVGPRSGSYKVLRGGSWYNDRNVVRCAYRHRYYPGIRNAYGGCRVARSSR
jgi:formylglycine-generating enzyme required for sulfatase activity